MHKEIKAIAISLSSLMLVPFSPAIYASEPPRETSTQAQCMF
jgi:hypothetical protein